MLDELESHYKDRKRIEKLANRAAIPAFLAPILGAYALFKYGHVGGELETWSTVFTATTSSALIGTKMLVQSETKKSEALISAKEANSICADLGVEPDRWIRSELDI